MPIDLNDRTKDGDIVVTRRSVADFDVVFSLSAKGRRISVRLGTAYDDSFPIEDGDQGMKDGIRKALDKVETYLCNQLERVIFARDDLEATWKNDP